MEQCCCRSTFPSIIFRRTTNFISPDSRAFVPELARISAQAQESFGLDGAARGDSLTMRETMACSFILTWKFSILFGSTAAG
jgi:hypothetical protein